MSSIDYAELAGLNITLGVLKLQGTKSAEAAAAEKWLVERVKKLESMKQK